MCFREQHPVPLMHKFQQFIIAVNRSKGDTNTVWHECDLGTVVQVPADGNGQKHNI